MALEPWAVLPVPTSKAREGQNAKWLEPVALRGLGQPQLSEFVCPFPLALPALELGCYFSNLPKENLGVPCSCCHSTSWICPEGRTRYSVAVTPVPQQTLQQLHQPGTAPQPPLYAQGCRKPPLCSCSSRKKRDCWMGGSVLLGITLDKTLLHKGCWELQTVRSAQQFVLSSKSRWL